MEPTITTVDPTTPPQTTERDEWKDALQADYERLLSVGEECVTESELHALLLRHVRPNTDATTKQPSRSIILYDGFEPSGRMHIAQGVYKAVNVNKCTQPLLASATGATATTAPPPTFVFYVADWFALMNDKMGGDLDKIQTVGHYLQEVWQAAGMNLQHVQFCWASHEVTAQAATYWPLMLDVARRFNVTRIKKCGQIMGRHDHSLTAAQIHYPLMQCTDVFFLKADICQLGLDQRKVNMLAREYADAARLPHNPIILSHHMLAGLLEGQEKMSKSNPDSAIFMEDTVADVQRKIQHAFCPKPPSSLTAAAAVMVAAESTTSPVTTTATDPDTALVSETTTTDAPKNPCLEFIQYIVLSPPGATFTTGGTVYTDFAAVRDDFYHDRLSKDQLKAGLIDALNQLLEPVRQHFTHNARAKELFDKVRQYKLEAAAATVRRLNLVSLGHVPAGSHLVLDSVPTGPTHVARSHGCTGTIASRDRTRTTHCVAFARLGGHRLQRLARRCQGLCRALPNSALRSIRT